jgi:hypothetical protein
LGAVALVVLFLTTSLLTACGERYSGGQVLYVVRGTGATDSATFQVDDGTYLTEERSQPSGCVSSVAILGEDGHTVTTLKPPPSVGTPDPTKEDEWNGGNTDFTKGSYHAHAIAPEGCTWAVRVSVPAD